jgi:hypothetical protein
MMKKDLTTDLFLAAINIVTQSRKALKFDDQMIIHASIVNFPIGSGSKNLMN